MGDVGVTLTARQHVHVVCFRGLSCRSNEDQGNKKNQHVSRRGSRPDRHVVAMQPSLDVLPDMPNCGDDET